MQQDTKMLHSKRRDATSGESNLDFNNLNHGLKDTEAALSNFLLAIS